MAGHPRVCCLAHQPCHAGLAIGSGDANERRKRAECGRAGTSMTPTRMRTADFSTNHDARALRASLRDMTCSKVTIGDRDEGIAGNHLATVALHPGHRWPGMAITIKDLSPKAVHCCKSSKLPNSRSIANCNTRWTTGAAV